MVLRATGMCIIIDLAATIGLSPGVAAMEKWYEKWLFDYLLPDTLRITMDPWSSIPISDEN
jgi:hypothetical protein